jgi:catechol 2,3-dioxygenase-like lactoylglutathione lyase family enzyme
MALRLHSVTFDCDDPAGLASFWAAVTGYQTGTVSPFYAELVGTRQGGGQGGGDFGPKMMFIKVPESKAAKNRVHLDLGADVLDDEVERVLGLGAELVGRYDEWGITWVTFCDPEGNEFCIGHHPLPPPEEAG